MVSSRANVLYRLTGTPSETEPDWRHLCCRTIHSYSLNLRHYTREMQEATALDLQVSSREWVQKPGPDNTGGFQLLNHPPRRYFGSIGPMPQPDRSGGGV
jgi:hypothetical protein